MIRTLSIIVVVILGLGICDYFGWIWHNSIFTIGYEVKGLDVSHHQGKIDWQKVKAGDKYKFVFIKATEGKDFVDDSFAYNWKESKKQNFLTGAYHFFAMTSSGLEQANHYKRIVPVSNDNLPPVIDVEIPTYHNKAKVLANLKTMIKELEKTYHKKPILYVTYDTYFAYIEDSFSDFPIWIRDVYKYPSIDKEKWKIWQYHNRGHIQGIDTFVDINVFNGNLSQLQLLK
jgi:lysozyme